MNQLKRNLNFRGIIVGLITAIITLILTRITQADTVHQYQSIDISKMTHLSVQKRSLSTPTIRKVSRQRNVNNNNNVNGRQVGKELYLSMTQLSTIATTKNITNTKATKKNKTNTNISEKQQINFKTLKGKVIGSGGVQVLFDKDTAVPALIKPLGSSFKSNLNTLDHLTVAKHFLTDNQDLLKINNADNEFSLIKNSTDTLSQTHLKFQQKIQGIPVWGKQIIVHLDKNNEVYLFQGSHVPTTLNLNITPKLSSNNALDRVLIELNYVGNLYAPAENELTILMKDGKPMLAYKVEINPTIDTRWMFFIDAQTGSVIHKINNIQSDVISASGVDLNGVNRTFNAWLSPIDSKYYLIDPSTPTLAQNADPVQDGSQSSGDTYILDTQNTEGSSIDYSINNTPDNWHDSVAVSAAYNTKLTYEYYLNTFNRNSVDGNGMNLISIIHFDQNFENAFWNGTAMIYGDGGSTFSPLAGCLDVAAHEMTHGVIQNTANLIYENQSGALNESFADVFGSMVDREDWLMGEDCTLASPGYLRDLQNPSNGLGAQPKHMNNYLNLPNTESGDNGGVHINSGIPNRAAYLISEGLTTEALGTSIGRGDTEQIYYRALTTYLTASSQFIDARRALIQSADDLFGQSSTQSVAVATAFDSVGIIEGSSTDTTPKSTDPINGDDVMVYLFPADGTHDNSAEDFQLYAQVMDNPFAGYNPAKDFGPYNATADGDLPVRYTKPAAFTNQNGTAFVYIAIDNNIYQAVFGAIDIPLSTSSIFNSFAISPNGRYIAYTTILANDNNLYIVDFDNGGTVSSHEIIPEDFQDGDTSTSSSILFADSLAFDYTSNNIVFDALNCLSTPTSACATGDGFRYWSIGLFEIDASRFLFPIANQSPDFDIGYPSFAANNNFVIAMDFLDSTNFPVTGLINSGTISIDFETQSFNLIHASGSFVNRFWSVPSFWGEDNYVNMQATVSPAQTGIISASRIAVNSSWQGVGLVTEPVNNFAVAMPIMHRMGERVLTGTLTSDTTILDFGSVELGSNNQLIVTLSNNGNNDISITNITSAVSNFENNGVNTNVPRGESLTVQVNYTPTQTGTEIDDLVFENSGQDGNVVISLTATGVDTTVPVITPPADLSADETTNSGIPVSDAVIQTFLNAASATDVGGLVGDVTNDAPAIFAVGTTTTVTFSATDTAGNTGTATATVTVNDITAPSVIAPANITVEATSSAGTAATNETIAAFLNAATANDNVGVEGTISNDAPTNFGAGTTTLITFSATDAAGNTGTATASVTIAAFVNPPAANSSSGGGGSIGLLFLFIIFFGSSRLIGRQANSETPFIDV